MDALSVIGAENISVYLIFIILRFMRLTYFSYVLILHYGIF